MADQEYDLLNLYDTEIIDVEQVLKKLQESQKKSRNLESFRQEILGRFAEIGLVVNVKAWTTGQDGVFAFDVEITGRTHPVKWDPDRQVHEVVNDVLGVLPNSEKGQWIKGPKGDFSGN